MDLFPTKHLVRCEGGLHHRIFHLPPWAAKMGGGPSELETDPLRAPLGLLGFRVKSSSNSLYGFWDIDDTVQGALATKPVFMISEFM